MHPARCARRTFEQTVQLLEPFFHREGRAPTVRETIRVGGDAVNLGAWLAKARTKHRTGQLPDNHARLIAALKPRWRRCVRWRPAARTRR
ncbi:hypothetical protein ACFT1B_18370 [Streptomyces griseoincarnatus]